MSLMTEKEIKYYKENKQLITFELLQALRETDEGKDIALQILDTEQDEQKYYIDAYNKKMSFFGNKAIKKSNTLMRLSQIHIDEMKRCSDDINYFMQNYVRILTPKKGVSFPELRQYQADFLKILETKENETILSLQPRQSGKSVVTGIWLLHKFCFEKELTIGIVSNNYAGAQEFLDKTKKMFVLLPMWLQCGVTIWNKRLIADEKNVRITIDVPSNNSFRGWTISYLVVDEADWIAPDKFKEMLDAILPTQSSLAKKKNIFITTPNGKQQFYEMWQEAGDTLETSKSGAIRYKVNWMDVPRYDSNGNLLHPMEFRDRTIAKEGKQNFAQNYEVSFIGSSSTIIDGDILDRYIIKQPIEKDCLGINVYEDPIPGHKYTMGVDSAKEGQDYFALQILDITDLNFRQVVAGHLQVDYLTMIDVLVEYGRKYNQALMIIENNEGSGQSIADIIKRDFDYENLFYEYKKDSGKKLKYPGFRTTKQSRDMMLQTIRMLSEYGRLELCDQATIDEFYNFVEVKGKYQAQGRKHDDLVMAIGLSLAIFNNVKNFQDFKEVVDNIKSGESINNDYLTIGGFDDGETDEDALLNRQMLQRMGVSVF